MARKNIYLILFLLGLVAYAPVLRVGFLWDDPLLIEKNPSIQSWSLSNIKRDLIPTASSGADFPVFLRPVVTWSYRLDYSLWGLHPAGYHLTTLLIHIANALLVYELILLLGVPSMAALLTATLFVVHPIGVEGLLRVTGRPTSLSFFFGLLTLILLADPTPGKLAAGLAAFALALGSKEEAVVLPALVMLVWGIRREARKRFLLIIPPLLCLGLYLSYRRHLFGSVSGAHDDAWFFARFFVMAYPRILLRYITLILFPWKLHSHRMMLPLSHFWPVALIGWLSLGIWSWHEKNRRPWILFCVVWVLGTLLPPSVAMFHNMFMTEDWGYWLAPGVLLPFGILFDRLWAQRHVIRQKRLALCFFPLLMAYALLTRLNIELRNTDEKMYRWALNFTPSLIIQYRLATLLVETGRAREALPYFEEIRAVYPRNDHIHYVLAMTYRTAGYPQTAKLMLQDLLARNPTYQPALTSLDEMKSIQIHRKTIRQSTHG